MQDAGIVRNRAKIEGSVLSARAFLEIERSQSFSDFIWGFVDGKPVQNSWKERGQMPVESETSRRISKALAEKGFKFCGPTIVYAFMQAVGMVNDHFVGCYRHAECAALAKATGKKASKKNAAQKASAS
jgi:DNA-3-methyladenine glycosylase I